MSERSPFREILSAAALVFLLPGCGDPPDSSPALEGEGGPATEISVSGTYYVDGLTVEESSGVEREISGSVILVETEGEYTATFHLSTVFPAPGGAVRSDVIGNGQGLLEGGLLEGTAETQIVAAAIPGVDPKFAFIPRTVSTRIVSTTVGRIEDDGTLTIEIVSVPAEGETYVATRTSLRGSRIPADEEAEALPDVAAPPR